MLFAVLWCALSGWSEDSTFMSSPPVGYGSHPRRESGLGRAALPSPQTRGSMEVTAGLCCSRSVEISKLQWSEVLLCLKKKKWRQKIQAWVFMILLHAPTALFQVALGVCWCFPSMSAFCWGIAWLSGEARFAHGLWHTPWLALNV